MESADFFYIFMYVQNLYKKAIYFPSGCEESRFNLPVGSFAIDYRHVSYVRYLNRVLGKNFIVQTAGDSNHDYGMLAIHYMHKWQQFRQLIKNRFIVMINSS